METSPEFEFLLHCLSLGNGADNNDFKVNRNIDWGKWKELVISHGVVPQVYKSISKRNHKSPGLPEKLLEELKELFLVNTARNTRLCQELNSLINKMRAKGLRVIPFKGPVLAVQASRDYGCRSYSDLDVLIDKRDFSRFYDCMEQLGYQPCFPLNERARYWWARFGRDYVFCKEKFFLDVHSRIRRGPVFGGLEKRMMAECRQIRILDQQVTCLSIEYSILGVCINAAKDGWSRLCYVTDLSYLVHYHHGLKWHELTARAKKMRVYTMLCVGLRLSSEFLGLRLPDEIGREDLESAKVIKLARIYGDNLKKGNIENKKFSMQRLEMEAVDTYWAKFRYLCYYMFIPRISDLKAIPLPSFMFPVYLLLRPLLLFIRMFETLKR